MANFFVSMGNAVVDRTPEELIAAVMIAAAVALAMSGLYCLKRRTALETVMPVIVLMLFANLISMAIGAGYLAESRRKPRGQATPWPHGGASIVSDASLVEAVFREADKNKDGLLSSAEASVAAERFVRERAPQDSGLIDARSLNHLLANPEFRRRERFGQTADRLAPPRGPRNHPRNQPPSDSSPRPAARFAEPETSEGDAPVDPAAALLPARSQSTYTSE